MLPSPWKREFSTVVIPVETGMQYSCHPRENGDPVTLSSPRRRGSSEYKSSRFPPPRE
ncbi:MAG: hypothetical protein SFT93_01430 [Rickettsiaceae bacterium]|nr:hypothetical protein [Rickettsiaceae bacterium]